VIILLAVGNVVQEFKIGNTKVRICDDFCLTPEETEKKIDKISNMLSVFFRNMPEEKIIEINKRKSKDCCS